MLKAVNLVRGGNIFSIGFFSSVNFGTDRYIHHRVLRMVSLKSPPSVEYGIKNIKIFVFKSELSWFVFL